jgi:hypothetical protein
LYQVLPAAGKGGVSGELESLPVAGDIEPLMREGPSYLPARLVAMFIHEFSYHCCLIKDLHKGFQVDLDVGFTEIANIKP